MEGGHAGLEQIEIDLLTVAERAGPSGQLFPSEPTNHIVAKYSQQRVREALGTLMKAKQLIVTRVPGTPSDVKQFLLQVPRLQVSDSAQQVFSVVQDAGSDGIDAIMIGARTKLSRAEVQKCLQTLVNNKCVNETRSFVNRAQKIYMLSTVQPSEKVTGGSFFEKRQLDIEFIAASRDVIHAALRQRGPNGTLKVREMKAALDSNDKTAKKGLELREVAVLARTLELDDLIRPVSAAGSSNVAAAAAAAAAMGQPPKSVLIDDFAEACYMLGTRSTSSATYGEFPPIEMAWAAAVPCAGCPHINECDMVNGTSLINPNKCKYMTAWIDRALPQQQQQLKNNNVAAAASSAGSIRERESGAAGPVRPVAPK